jgi:AAA ATPase-like protein
MQLISALGIRNFRSIRNIEIDGIADFSCFCGQNNVGKSNILKALNLFFNDETDPKRTLNIDDDYNVFERTARRKAIISIELHFRLPPFFKFRRELQVVSELIGDEFAIKKIWTRDSPEPSFQLNGQDLDAANSQLVRQFLSLIRFRYIPNRVLPIDIIRSEQKAITDSLIRRLKFSSDESERVFEHFREQATALAANLGSEFSALISNFSNISLSTPQAWGELIFNLGYRVSEGLDDELQGSGAQSVLMLETLALVDRDYYKQFGWRQATIWGFEEPESSLHHSLELGVAKKIKSLTENDSVRLQVFCTTHANSIVEYSQSPFFVKRENKTSEVFPMLDGAHIEEIWNSGVAPWIHPLLRNPGKTILIFEGKFDFDLFNVVKGFLPGGLNLHGYYLGNLDNVNASGGDSRLYQYLQNNVAAIKQRENKGDLHVVLDWDSARRVAQFQSLCDSQTYKVSAWSELDLNPDLADEFRGVERALDTSLIQEVAAANNISLVTRKGKLAVLPAEYSDLKRFLNDRITMGVTPNQVRYVAKFFHRLLA